LVGAGEDLQRFRPCPLPPIFKIPAAGFGVDVGAGQETAVRVGQDGPRVGAGLLPQAVFFEAASYSTKADHGTGKNHNGSSINARGDRRKGPFFE
jgi:hypothetical protein